MFSADNEAWYDQIATLARPPASPASRLQPQFDPETAALYTVNSFLPGN